MNRIRLFLPLALSAALLGLPGLGLAKGDPKAPPPRSMSSGFSSKPTKPATPTAVPDRASAATPPPAAKPSFGAFGAAKDSTAAPLKSTSGLTQGLDTRAAETNALKTLDARTAQKSSAGDLANTGTTAVSSQAPAIGATAGATQQAQVTIPQAPAPTVIYQNSGSSGNGVLAGVAGYMLGRSMDNHDRNQSGPGWNNGGPASPNESAMVHVATWPRVLAWLVFLSILGAVGWAIWRFVQRSRVKALAPPRSNYSL